MPNYRLLALDLDGTTLTGDNSVSKQTRHWIRYAADNGVTVIFATGRGTQTAKSFWEELRLDSPMVLVNGAEVWKSPGELLERHVLGHDDVRRLHKLAADAGAWFWGYSTESLTSKRNWTEEMFARDWMKFGIRHDDVAVIRRLRETVESWGTVEVTRSAPVNMEISPKGISKETGVRAVCGLLGIDIGDVMAIGDNLNDLRLIQASGLGVAMGNADDELKRAADKLTDTNDRDGVAKAIRRYLFGLEADETSAMHA
ncbi:Cof-type HAD-IIB family hydrolase [Paenibacillus sp. GYB003]|uniref:Cof-type HAD-IIB family hydrolase n=1 Tax=Paenibacillus sp. GYB003 TaxID=2994392 RepID=UPI002F9616E4